MNARIRLLALALVFAVLPVTVHAGAIIDWDPIFTWEPGATPTNSPPGGVMQAVGIVSDFGPPLDFLDANDPNTEYTIYMYNLTSTGTVSEGPPSTTFYTTSYTGGIIEIYAGSPRNSVFDPNPPNANVPSTFTDGTLILSGTFDTFYTQTNNFTAFQTGNMEGTISFTGGTLIDLLRDGSGDPCPGLFTGGLTWNTGVVIPGYTFRHDGKIDLNCPTPAEKSTWGRIKSTYGD